MPITATPGTASTSSESSPNNRDSWTQPKRLYDPIAEARFWQRIDELRSLKPNWDLEGAAAPDERLIDDVKQFCQRSVSYPVPEANPTCDGGVQLEWHIDSRTLEIEFGPEGPPAYICWDQRDPDLACEGAIEFPASSGPGDVRRFEEKVEELLAWVQGG